MRDLSAARADALDHFGCVVGPQRRQRFGLKLGPLPGTGIDQVALQCPQAWNIGVIGLTVLVAGGLLAIGQYLRSERVMLRMVDLEPREPS